MKIRHKNLGDSFDDFLEEEGLLNQAESAAYKRVITFQMTPADNLRDSRISERFTAVCRDKGENMRIVKAKVVDSTHLELCQPILFQSGEYVNISIPEGEEGHLWREASGKHFFNSYSDEDSVYDKI